MDKVASLNRLTTKGPQLGGLNFPKTLIMRSLKILVDCVVQSREKVTRELSQFTSEYLLFAKGTKVTILLLWSGILHTTGLISSYRKSGYYLYPKRTKQILLKNVFGINNGNFIK
ncbi:hypothetical protein llap_9137 [Limosa lapponica baueri]|uniref:Uncharacterized protein n=1 Tax=Limosa lapponica baueri TaxID=1758121 RepID=A0A2I0U3F0_LIMLA|nr:hypothetical protein llap_9137 [Limosa lapponica baueri]